MSSYGGGYADNVYGNGESIYNYNEAELVRAGEANGPMKGAPFWQGSPLVSWLPRSAGVHHALTLHR